ncbi:MAG: NAD(P)H-dependent oxidoreductase [Flavobacteriales bacterium]
MKKKIIALAGSNSKNSINKELAYYAAGNMTNADVIYLDLNDFVMPMYGIDEENENGMPEAAQNLSKLIVNADGIILSLAEHNGSYSAVFKNTFDWISRIDAKVFETSPLFLLSTSPGARAGKSVMDTALDRFPRHGATIVTHFSLPSFYDNFKEDELVNPELKAELMEKVKTFENSI